MPDKIVFADPPPSTRGGNVWEKERFPVLLDNLGKWVDATATWGCSGNNSSQVKKAAERCDLAIEAVGRTNGDGTRHLYVRAI